VIPDIDDGDNNCDSDDTDSGTMASAADNAVTDDDAMVVRVGDGIRIAEYFDSINAAVGQNIDIVSRGCINADDT